MIGKSWSERSLLDRIRWLQVLLPPLLALIVVGYQLGVARALEENYGHTAHYAIEIAFYSLTGPVATWLTLAWVSRRLEEKEALERKVRARTRQLVSLTEASPDAILSLDADGKILSWNNGAARIFGYAPEEIIGRRLQVLLPDGDQLLDRLRTQQAIEGIETPALTNSNVSLTVELTQTYLRGEDGVSAVGLMIVRDVTARREREAIRAEERARIARDLHDGVAQNLYFLALKADHARQHDGEGAQPTQDTFKEIGQGIRRVIREVRRTIFALSPADWSPGGFLPAIRGLIAGMAEQVGWQVEVEVNSDFTALPARLEPTLYRLVQESLNNVAKHAEAQRVCVRMNVAEDPARVMLEIEDDGRGLSPEPHKPAGVGLSQMEARVRGAGGQFTLTSKPGQGVRVQASLPILAGVS